MSDGEAAPGPMSVDPPRNAPRISGYRIQERIRRGPDATVYRALTEDGDEPVALKVLRSETAQVTELALLPRLPAHPHLVRVVDTGRTDDGRPYLAMAYHPDGSYADALAQGGPLPVAEAVRVAVAVAEALQVIHDAGLIHRDVTPDNILCGVTGPVLADFGIAADPDELAGTVALDRLTPPHAAPEALRRQRQDARSDVYSLASTLWTLLAGHPPFAVAGDRTPDPFAYREDTLHRPVPPVSRAEVPARLQALLARGMAKEPEARFGSAGEFAAALSDPATLADSTATLSDQPAPVASVTRTGPVIEVPAAGSTPTGSTGGGTQGSVRPPDRASPGQPLAPAAPSSAPAVSVPVPAAAVPVPAASAAAAPETGMADSGGSLIREAVVVPPARSAIGAPQRRGRRGARRAVAAVIGLVLGAATVLLLVRPGTEPQAGPEPTPSASRNQLAAPRQVGLRDERIAVTLTWQDGSAGQAPSYVVGGPVGRPPSTLANGAAGVTSVRVNGLNPTVDYCFVVVAVLSVDEVAHSEEVCTRRSAPGPSR